MACIRSHGAKGDDAVDMQAVVSGFVFAAPRHFGEYQHARLVDAAFSFNELAERLGTILAPRVASWCWKRSCRPLSTRRLSKVPGPILQKEVGAPQGYNEFLEAIADPKHERQKELREWSGKDSICCISTDINHALAQFSPRKSTRRKSAESAITE